MLAHVTGNQSRTIVIRSTQTQAHLNQAQNSKLKPNQPGGFKRILLIWLARPYFFLFLYSLSLSLPLLFYLSGICVLAVAVETRHTNTAAVDRKCCGTTMASLRLWTRSRLLSLSLCPSQHANAIILSKLYGDHTALSLSLISLIIISIAFSAVPLSFSLQF